MAGKRVIEEPPKRRRKRRKKRHGVGRFFLFLLILVLLAAAGYAAWRFVLPRFIGTEAVPDISVETEDAVPADESEDEPAEEPAEDLPEEQHTITQTGSDEEDAEEDVSADQAETEEPDPCLEQAQGILDGMTLTEKLYQLFIVAPEMLTGTSSVTSVGSEMTAILAEKPVGGVIFFEGNITDREQVTGLISGLQSASELPLFISVDEEGGTVSRLGSKPGTGVTSFPDMSEIGDTHESEQAYSVGYTLGTELLDLGFNLDFAPVADVNTNPNNPVIGNRAFSSDANIASEMVYDCVTGFNDAGILCTLKHFPGHGDTATDSHYNQATTGKTLEELEECELLPFISGIQAGAPIVMVGHISIPQVTGNDTPASLSSELIDGLLRQELGFDGLVVTDALNMGAITNRYTSAQAAVAAIQAGADILLMPADLESAISGLSAAIESGELTEERINESVLRILEAKISTGIIAADSETAG